MRLLKCSFLNQYSYSISSTSVNRFLKRFASSDPRNKAPFVRDKVHVNVCCLGQSGHGKTTLSSAISLIQSKSNCAIYKSVDDIDKSPEEKSKGQSIIPCKLEFTTKSKHVVLSDLPGSQDYIKNTIFGASGSDIGIVVINCNEGPTEQTRNHLIIARQQGVKQLIGFINQFDEKTDHESLEICELATREMITEEGFNSNSVKFISGSTIAALNNQPNGIESIESLVSTLESLANPERNLNCPGLFYIDKIYSPQGRGTGVTGTINQGKLAKGQIVDCIGFNRHIKTKINYIECFNKVLEEAVDGDSVEIVLQGVKRDDIIRGMTICPSGEFNQQNNIQVQLQLLKSQSTHQKVEALITTNLVNLHFQTGDLLGQVILSKDKDYLLPGSSDLVEIKLLRSCILLEGQSLIFRDGDQIIGFGEITKLLDPLTTVEQQKLIKGRSRKEKEQFKLLVDKIQSQLNPTI